MNNRQSTPLTSDQHKIALAIARNIYDNHPFNGPKNGLPILDELDLIFKWITTPGAPVSLDDIESATSVYFSETSPLSPVAPQGATKENIWAVGLKSTSKLAHSNSTRIHTCVEILDVPPGATKEDWKDIINSLVYSKRGGNHPDLVEATFITKLSGGE